ncbi:hypothetical protein HW555_000428 [Spodoptera exigua]|uniref:HAT C-terminal dimerisation domain-containing protein n=1 Tax=Spodoptera exigua TaxID=7107 RepID=A0A835GS39_SPOEX|nr:hypothetical protein HW555_000428 [Spodoptera exigua]
MVLPVPLIVQYPVEHIESLETQEPENVDLNIPAKRYRPAYVASEAKRHDGYEHYPSSTSRQEERGDINNDCDSSSTMREEPLPKKQKQQRDFNENWLTNTTFKNWISKREQECGTITAYCKVCNCTVLNHKPALVKHMNTAKHVQNISSKSQTIPIQQMLKPKPEDELRKRAELKICAFLAHHNLSFSLMDDLIPFLKNTLTDSNTIKSISLGRTKATNTIKTVLGLILTQELIDKLKKTPFSIIMDETTDISVKKQCALAVIYYDEVDCVRTQFLDIYEVKSGKAEDLCNSLLTWLEDRQIPLKNFVGFASDTTNSMVGEHHSVFSHLKQKVPHIACIKCSCHMIHLVASKACLKLPRSVEDFLRSIGAHFSRSTKRQKKLKEFQDFFGVDIHKILSPATTRWLSLEACVNRTLEQYQVLVFHRFEMSNETQIVQWLDEVSDEEQDVAGSDSEDETVNDAAIDSAHDSESEIEESEDIQNISEPSEDKIKARFGRDRDALPSDDTEMNAFLGLLIMAGVLRASHLNFIDLWAQDGSGQLAAALVTDHQKRRIQLRAVPTTTKKRLREVHDVDETVQQSTAKRGRCSSCPRKNDKKLTKNLHKEWKKHAFLDFSELNMSPDLPVEEYWNKILKMTDGTGEPMFPNLKEIIKVLLVLPFSNACVERVFSQLKLIKSDQRNRLNADTIAALMATKAAVKNATTFEPSKALMHAKIKCNTDGDGDGEGRC